MLRNEDGDHMKHAIKVKETPDVEGPYKVITNAELQGQRTEKVSRQLLQNALNTAAAEGYGFLETVYHAGDFFIIMEFDEANTCYLPKE